MFKKRLITALVLIPIVLILISLKNIVLIKTLTIVLTLLCAREWANLIPTKKVVHAWVFTITVGLLALGSGYLTNSLVTVATLFWLVNIIAVIRFPQSQSWWGYSAYVVVAGYVLLSTFYLSLTTVYQQQQGWALILYLLFIVWAADIGAYITGKICGRHKLLVKVSPGKTLEGAMGGLLLAFIIASIMIAVFHWRFWPGWLLTAILVLISIFGDLFVSMLKRRCSLKDTGNILPGHGGILDRLDSLIAAAPFCYLAIKYGLI